MSNDKINFDTHEEMLQETNRWFIVLDRNDCLVFCNESLNATYSESLQRYFLSSTSFWLKKEHRTFDISEFSSLAGKQIDLIFKGRCNEFSDITLSVEEVESSGQKFYVVSQVATPQPIESNIHEPSEYLLDQLIRDLQAGQVTVHYQPQVNTQTDDLYGVEALCRWNRGKELPIPPDQFVALAEDFNFVAELDLWVLNHVCQQLTKWQKKGIDVPVVSVNFSPISLNRLKNHERIVETLINNKTPADKIIIEITEGQKFNYCDKVIASMIDLHSIGIRFSLDDFGIGYSNFKRLTRIPVSQLKLDRSFVLHLPEQAYREICHSTLLIGKKLELSVIAEGVENTDQLDILKSHDCHIFQGYLFSKPLPAAEFENWFYHFHSSSKA